MRRAHLNETGASHCVGGLVLLSPHAVHGPAVLEVVHGSKTASCWRVGAVRGRSWSRAVVICALLACVLNSNQKCAQEAVLPLHAGLSVMEMTGTLEVAPCQSPSGAPGALWENRAQPCVGRPGPILPLSHAPPHAGLAREHSWISGAARTPSLS